MAVAITKKGELIYIENVLLECNCGAELAMHYDPDESKIIVSRCYACEDEWREDAYNDGYDCGHTDGEAEGYDMGREEGFTDGHNEGFEEGRTEGYDEGYTKGYDDGYEQGYIKARSDLYERE